MTCANTGRPVYIGQSFLPRRSAGRLARVYEQIQVDTKHCGA